MSDVMTKPVAELKKLLKQPLYDLVLEMQRIHATVVAERDEALALVEVHEATIIAGAHVIQTRNERTERDCKQLLEQDETNRHLSSDFELTHDKYIRSQDSNRRLREQLREEQKAHQKTRDKVKTAPRIRIESTALVEMSKTGQDADSNLSEMFGNCDVTVTAPKKEEARRPRRGAGDLMSILKRESGMSSGMRTSTPISQEILRKISEAMSLRGMTECPVCRVTDPMCPIDGILSGVSGALSDCVHNGPGTNCEFCSEECRYAGMPAELGEFLTAKTGDGTLVFDEIIVMGGPSGGGFAMSDVLGRKPGHSGL